MILTMGTAGLLIACLFDRLIGYKVRDIVAVLLMGLVGVTIYAEVWSLFSGTGILANVCMCICLLLMTVYYRSQVCALLRDMLSGWKDSGAVIPVFIVLFFVMSYGASHGLMHYDTGLYHAQAIRWIEEYGCVPGLANLHTRLGYNSSAFVLNALYSFAFTGQSYHVTGAFCALLLAWECAYIPVREHRLSLDASGLSRIMGIYYLLMIFDEMVSPASDYYMVCLGFILIIRWLDSGSDVPRMSMLAVLTAFILTIKLSGAVFVLLAVMPGFLLLRDHHAREFGYCLTAGIITVVPYLARNIVLSGWLLYPSTFLGFFKPEWRVPVDIATYDYKEIQVYGRGYWDVSRYGEPIYKWFPTWFGTQSATDRILIGAAVVGVVYFVIKCLYYVCRAGRERDVREIPAELFIEAVICIGFLFWLLTSPLMRYGCLYVYLCNAVLWGGVLSRTNIETNSIRFVVYSGLMILCVYKGIMFAAETTRAYRDDTWIRQQDYDRFEVHSYELTGEGSHLTLYAPDDGDRTGYDPFPSSPWDKTGEITLRGDDVRDGFLPLSNK